MKKSYRDSPNAGRCRGRRFKAALRNAAGVQISYTQHGSANCTRPLRHGTEKTKDLKLRPVTSDPASRWCLTVKSVALKLSGRGQRDITHSLGYTASSLNDHTHITSRVLQTVYDVTFRQDEQLKKNQVQL